MTEMSKAEYLKRYMAADPDEEKTTKKKRRKIKKIKAGAGFKIVDEDLDLSKIGAGNDDAEEENPIIAEIIDDRPDSVKQMEVYLSTDKWKKVVGDENSQSVEPLETSPPRRKRHDSDTSPPGRRRHDSDTSPSRRRRHDSDTSPPRRKRHDSDTSPLRKKRHDSDTSPPRRKRHDSDTSPPRRRHGSDTSPPRRKRHDSDTSPPRRKGHDSDTSPPRRRRHDSDTSPLRRRRHGSDSSPPRRKRNIHDKSSHKNGALDTSAKKTLSGKTAGLSSAQEMKKEAEKLKLKEIEMFNKIGDEKLGRNAEAVFRDKSGKKRDLKAEKEASDVKEAEWKKKYDNWGRGVAQGAAEQERVADMVHEMSKPLARARDDADLDTHLKQLDREGDPMLKFIKQKESKRKGPKYPQYKGPAPEPNRFGIKPGYRWDGVDRGNGFEKKYFQSISSKKAVGADAYKWSTEDM
ncbi:BUD13 homolog [Watersipora subatra]|uniref:BUD13 homolog n=1 Tax=Watersipora subatra TaxID=2589382 RepID=UPI00355AE272